MKNRNFVIAIIAVIAVIALFLGIYFATRPTPNEGIKAFTVVVVHSDGSTAEFSCESGEKYLGRALVDAGLVADNQDQYGLYIQEVDGERAVWEENGAWWGIYIGEESATTGADQIALTDGETYKLVYTIG